MTDRELLARYALGSSEEAFAEIVRRHMDKVYSTCLRVLGEAERARDAAQATFLVLSRKAHRIGPETVLSGWLFLAARHSALALRKQEARRARHEREAGAMRRAACGQRWASWEEVRPQLDEAVAALPARQRDAVVLCYLGGRTQAQAACELGCPQSTVSRRLTGALERLRGALSRRGLALSAAALAAMLAEHGTVPAPAGLVTAVQAACAGTAAASALAASVSKGVLNTMAWAKVKMVAAAVAIAAAAAGGTLAARSLSAEPAPAAAAAGGSPVLTQASPWRSSWVWKTPMLKTSSGLAESKARDFICETAPVEPGWQNPEFDDSAWSRWRISWTPGQGQDYGFRWLGGGGPCVAMQCLRGRFNVDNPGAVQNLALSMEYRGGAVVYVNGQELKRAHLPKEGKLTAGTLAEDYPAEAFMVGGKCIMDHAIHYSGKVQKNAAELNLRIRRMENVAIPASMLRKGVNVLAVELHWTAYLGPGMEKEGLNHGSVWSTCGLVKLELRAGAGAAPNLGRPAGVQVWSASPMTRSTPADFADPIEPARPVRIVGAPNGTFDGKVTVSSAEALKGVKATVSDLVQKGGAKIPASAIKVLYTARDDRLALRYRTWGGFWDALYDSPPAEVQPFKDSRGRTSGAIQPIVVKVRVPADAAPGDYQGRLSVSTGAGSPVDVPVHLRVVGWKLPDPKDLGLHLGIIESPESVAMWYKVPLWSEEHWKLVEKSFALLGEVGNKYLVIPLMCRTNFGNTESMVRWVKDGKGGYTYDFTVFDRYLDIALKHTSPEVICLYVWDRYTGQWMWAGKGDLEAKSGVLVTLHDPATGKSQELEGPKLGTPEAKAFLEPVYKEVRARLEKRGVLDRTMMGLNGDAWKPTKAISDMLKELMPGAKWVNNSHADTRGSNVNGIPVGYNTIVYVDLFPAPGGARADKGAKNGRYYGWLNPARSGCFPRSHGAATYNPLYHSASLGLHRTYGEAALLANQSGLGRLGADFWEVLAPPTKRTTGKRSDTLNGRFPESCWNQLNMNTATEALLGPGPDGPVTTERFENLRECAQDSEARIFLEKAIHGGKLPADLAGKCQAVLDERAMHIRAACIGMAMGWDWYEEAGSAGLRERLYSAAAEAAARTGVK